MKNSISDKENVLEFFIKFPAIDYFSKMDAIRKFSLECCDLTTMLSNVAVLLRFLTVNIDSKHHEGNVS